MQKEIQIIYLLFILLSPDVQNVKTEQFTLQTFILASCIWKTAFSFNSKSSSIHKKKDV